MDGLLRTGSFHSVWNNAVNETLRLRFPPDRRPG